ncbi:MAG: lysophospholipid acyltransferase family protein [Hyphomicrobium sp.]
MSTLRAGTLLSLFLAFTVPLMPLQAVFVRTWPWAARRFPHWYHRQVCRIIGVRLTIEGDVARDEPVLLISNHTSWLDIPVLSAVAPLSFVAKKEVAAWPFVSWLAKLQRTVFVDRERRTATGEAAAEITSRLGRGDAIVLFAEGTSSDGNRVLPFMSSLFGAVLPPSAQAGPPSAIHASVQTIAIVYTHHHGVPFSREQRSHVGWYGDMEMTGHAWQLLGSGPIDVTIRIGAPVPLAGFSGRKELAAASERQVRENVVRILRGRGPDDCIEVTEAVEKNPRSSARSQPVASKWR